MAGYSDTKQMIIDALMGRPEGTQIQPEDHQAYALNLLNYVRSVELSSGSTLTGIAEVDTVPIEPYNSKVAYITSVPQNTVRTFTYFKKENNEPITITTTNFSVFVILLWNTQYWEYQTLPVTVFENNSFVGYFECASLSTDVNKTISSEINQLTTDLRILVKMNNVNTQDNVTFQIGLSEAKPLYYNGLKASSTNSWSQGEVVDIYYNGTDFISYTHGGAQFSTGEKVGDVGIDNKPTAGSDNLVKSGGVYSKINQLNKVVTDYGQIITVTKIILTNLVEGEYLYYKFTGPNGVVACIGFFDSSNERIGSLIGKVSTSGGPYDYEGIALIPSGASYLKAITTNSGFVLNHLYYVDSIHDKISLLDNKKLDLGIGKNIFDNDLVPNYILKESGLPLSANNYSYTRNFLPVEELTEYSVTRNGGQAILNNSYGLVLFYDIHKTLLSTQSIQNLTVFTTPANTAYIRLNVRNAWNNEIQIEKGNARTAYEPFCAVGRYIPTVPNQSVRLESFRNGLVIPSNMLDVSNVSGLNKSQTNFFHLGKNLFNKDTVVEGFINKNGVIQPSTNGITTSDYIAVEAGQQYYASSSIHQSFRVAVFDNSKTAIPEYGSDTWISLITIPENGAYIRVSVYRTNELETFQVEKGIARTEYEPYGLYLDLSANTYAIQKLLDYSLKHPKILLPRKEYILLGQQNTIYNDSFIKDLTDEYYLDSDACTGIRNTNRYFRVDAATTSVGDSLTLYVKNKITGELVDSKTISVVSSNQLTDNGLVKLSVIGDSFTGAGYWWARCGDLCPNISFVGTKEARGNYAEGRSGWKLEFYMNKVFGTSLIPHSPFLHPSVGNYKYYGATATWKKILEGGTSEDMAGFENIANAIGFNVSDGFKSSPSIDDLMYDSTNNHFVRWNGSSWATTSSDSSELTQESLQFEFNYSKYLEVYGNIGESPILTAPNMVVIMLGTNDFRATYSDSYWNTWVTRMNTAITSIKSAISGVKIVLCLPTTIVFTGMGYYNQVRISEKINSNYRQYREKYIEEFDTLENESNDIYVVDTGSSFDSIYGFAKMTSEAYTKPFAEYTGNLTEVLNFNEPHPSPDGYKQIGMRLAAFIQAIR